ncbi:MAG: AbrB/MazE/SpoVT family DNA-binding domain-containing protein [Spiribacter salinus]|uniref:AbrB/MazE/SpoVT family DNA-binding domain-containing protein n=1 Tax=Spiribacter salinus TaxID=1335746 RepID=A0A540VF00_9GAMM|nr:MAG: AbrB/MazE/SpoVT family DNA-binding domain-containing protein [Spiribacter salinus]
MGTIKITAKRQATIPAEVCDELGIQPGDSVSLTPIIINDQRVWVMAPKTSAKVDWSWIGQAKVNETKSHDIEDIRASIGARLGADKS